MIKPEKRRVSITFTIQYVEALDDLVERGVYLDRGEAIRAGVRLIFATHNLEIMGGKNPSKGLPLDSILEITNRIGQIADELLEYGRSDELMQELNTLTYRLRQNIKSKED